jgi:hypothetical protein
MGLLGIVVHRSACSDLMSPSCIENAARLARSKARLSVLGKYQATGRDPAHQGVNLSGLRTLSAEAPNWIFDYGCSNPTVQRHWKEKTLSNHPKQVPDQVAAGGKGPRRPPEGVAGAGVATGTIGENPPSPRPAAETGTSSSARPADKAIPVDQLNASNDD